MRSTPDDDPLRPAREATASLVRSWVEANPEIARAPQRSDFVALGKKLWEVSYRLTKNDGEAFQLLGETMEQVLRGGDPYQATLASSFLYLPMDQIMMFWSARWADQAFPIFQMGHKYAAALLATSVNVDENAIRPPFSAFLIEVPIGLITITDDDGNSYDLRHVLAHHLKNGDGEWVWSYVAITTGRVTVWQHGASAKRMLEESHESPDKVWSDYSFGMEFGDRDQRINFLLQRLVLNTCLAVASPDNMKPLGKTAKMSPGELRGSPEPLVRTFQVGKPITLDCREAVHDYIAGRRPGRKLSVQVLVSGHWKTQPHGPRNSLRKVIWREPFWRGPEDAPILTRPHKLDEEV